SGINYQWSDGSDTVYTHWDAADDDDDFETGECVYMDVNGGWRRADCETLLPGALCHVPQSPSKPTECVKIPISRLLLLSLAGNKPLTANVMACPSTWVKFGHGCYSFESVAEKRSFEKSREHCRNK
ncbi:secretory phospholipase A2 receptor-like, partial [Neolamprologus brichardi]|uniref:secretory phospholipase A2 receptor-like n=1 Tax=Neolamprologus brichardi TaxID=32507 RepID=UPI0016439295